MFTLQSTFRFRHGLARSILCSHFPGTPLQRQTARQPGNRGLTHSLGPLLTGAEQKGPQFGFHRVFWTLMMHGAQRAPSARDAGLGGGESPQGKPRPCADPPLSLSSVLVRSACALPPRPRAPLEPQTPAEREGRRPCTGSASARCIPSGRRASGIGLNA